MATRTLESRLERMSVQDENDPADGTKHYSKSKVRAFAVDRKLIRS